ncbi:hypothetical protein ACWDRB_62245 [Nonomuraea sp. NPDC003707]
MAGSVAGLEGSVWSSGERLGDAVASGVTALVMARLLRRWVPGVGVERRSAGSRVRVDVAVACGSGVELPSVVCRGGGGEPDLRGSSFAGLSSAGSGWAAAVDAC